METNQSDKKWKQEISEKSKSVKEVDPSIADREVEKDENATDPQEETEKRTGSPSN